MKGMAVAACLMLAACVQPASVPTAEPTIQLIPDAQGLSVQPAGLRIDFGRAPSGVEATLDREVGPHQHMSLVGCPNQIADQLRWGDLVLSFTATRFVGWRQGNAAQGLTCG